MTSPISRKVHKWARLLLCLPGKIHKSQIKLGAFTTSRMQLGSGGCTSRFELGPAPAAALAARTNFERPQNLSREKRGETERAGGQTCRDSFACSLNKACSSSPRRRRRECCVSTRWRRVELGSGTKQNTGL